MEDNDFTRLGCVVLVEDMVHLKSVHFQNAARTDTQLIVITQDAEDIPEDCRQFFSHLVIFPNGTSPAAVRGVQEAFNAFDLPPQTVGWRINDRFATVRVDLKTRKVAE